MSFFWAPFVKSLPFGSRCLMQQALASAVEAADSDVGVGASEVEETLRCADLGSWMIFVEVF